MTATARLAEREITQSPVNPDLPPDLATSADQLLRSGIRMGRTLMNPGAAGPAVVTLERIHRLLAALAPIVGAPRVVSASFRTNGVLGPGFEPGRLRPRVK